MSLIDFKGVHLPELENVLSVENVDVKCCRCIPSSKCCIRINLCLEIKQRTKSFIRQISGNKGDIEILKD
jgi:hypothetical protein